MNCNCISEITDKVKESLLENSKFKRPIKRVEMTGLAIAFGGGTATERTMTKMEIELEGQKKLESVNLFHSFCPFCGKPQAPEEKTGGAA